MAVTLKTLLQVAPFPEENRKTILEKYDQLSEDQIMRLSQTAWTALAMQYYGHLEFETKQYLLEVADGKKTFNQNDLAEIKTRLMYDLVKKLTAAESETSLEEVRSELEKFQTKPLAQDSVSN